MRTAPFVIALGCIFAFSMPLSAAPQPVNPHASPEARALLAYLDSISGKGIVTGQHNFPNSGSSFTDLAYDLTGKYPGLFGDDFGFGGDDLKDSILARPAIVAEAKRQWANGAIVALTWHAVRPTDDEPVSFRDSVQGRLTDYEWRELLTPGTPMYKRWCDQVDVIAGYLRQLRDAHVPVLFRPYHEMNGNWFWWGYRSGKDGSAALYRQLYHRLVDVHRLDNLVWVWNVNAPSGNAGPIGDYYPGPEYVDVVTEDNYGEFKQEFYDDMVALAAGKPIAFAEVGDVPSLDVLARQPRWTYFMVWSGFLDVNRMELPNALYHAPQALNRDDPRLAEPLAAIRKAAAERSGPAVDPVAPGANKQAKALLATLAGASGKAILSGEQIAISAAAAATPARSAIVAAELDGAAPDLLLTAAKQARDRKAIVSLSWKPARPTDLGAARSSLTDFEWGELLTPGSDLNKRWCDQVDQAAKTLRALQDAGIAVLWNPYPEPNGKDYWWGGRTGIRGSAQLFRMLFDRLNQKDGLQNLVWVWQAGPQQLSAGLAGAPSDYFPGLLYADALAIRVDDLNGRFPADRLLRQLAVGKPVGVELSGQAPLPAALTGRSHWAWFVLDAAPDSAARADSLRNLYAAPEVISLSK